MRDEACHWHDKTSIFSAFSLCAQVLLRILGRRTRFPWGYRMRIFYLSALALMMPLALMTQGTPALFAQPADLPTPEDLFSEARDAVGLPAGDGGIGRIEAHASVKVTSPEGHLYYDTVAIGSVSERKLGNASFAVLREGGSEMYGETDGVIWHEDTEGKRETLPPAMAMYVRGHQFHRRALFPELELAATDPVVTEGEFEGEPVFKVGGTTHAGARLVYCYEQRGKKLIGMQLTVDEPDGPHPVVVALRDWRTTAGQSLFRRIDIKDRGKLYIYRFNRLLISP